MSAYVIYHYNIIDRSGIDALTEKSEALNEKYGAKILIASPVKALEGNTKSHLLVLEFVSFDVAEAYYYSPEHKALSVMMDQVTEGWATIVPDDAGTQALVDSGYFNC